LRRGLPQFKLCAHFLQASSQRFNLPLLVRNEAAQVGSSLSLAFDFPNFRVLRAGALFGSWAGFIVGSIRHAIERTSARKNGAALYWI
jgi:hypothetical protein